MLKVSKITQLAPVLVGALALAACGGETGTSSTSNTSTEGTQEVIDTSKTGALGEMFIGDIDAPLTVVEYASVTCPHCATFHETILPEIKSEFVDTGKVRFVFREFPTSPAELSVVGSMLARCAADKGGSDAYFLVLDSLFKTQKKWIYGDTRDELMKIAAQAGIDQQGFEACVARQDLVDLINENVDDGRKKYDVNSTPSFVLGGNLRHFNSADDMRTALNEALEKVEAQ